MFPLIDLLTNALKTLIRRLLFYIEKSLRIL